jgi:hypothetical protein
VTESTDLTARSSAPDTAHLPDEMPDAEAIEAAEAAELEEIYPRKVLFVAGAGRSGTSTLAGLVRILGLHVPQPEITADETNPKGFGEPAWAVEFHTDLLRKAGVQVSDARPAAWFKTSQVGGRERPRAAAAEWLEQHFAEASELVVKDPRLAWFLTMWEVAAVRSSATPVFATMLRPPSEVVASKETHYSNRQGSAHLAASWVNMMLHTERATRAHVDNGGRVFVRYADLLDDWTKTVMHVGETLQLQHILHAGTQTIREGHRFVDPNLRRMSRSLDELELPARLHEIVAESWTGLDRLAEPGGDTPDVHATLDQLRDAYSELYEEAEAISRSSALAARSAASEQAAAAEKEAERLARKADRLARHGGAGGAADPADRIPHRVRAMVPASLRQRLRRRWARRA